MLNDHCGLLIINEDTCHFRKMRMSVITLKTIPNQHLSKLYVWLGGDSAITSALFVEDTSADTDQSRWCLEGRPGHFRHYYGKLTRIS